MLTKDDRTVDGAREVYEELRGAGLRYVGFKDIGQPVPVLRDVCDTAHRDGLEVMLEVVSTSKEDELRSIEAAARHRGGLGARRHAPGRGRAAAGRAPGEVLPVPRPVVGHPSILDRRDRRDRGQRQGHHRAGRRLRPGPARLPAPDRGRGRADPGGGDRCVRAGHRGRLGGQPGPGRRRWRRPGRGASRSAARSSTACCPAGRRSPARSARCSGPPAPWSDRRTLTAVSVLLAIDQGSSSSRCVVLDAAAAGAGAGRAAAAVAVPGAAAGSSTTPREIPPA